MIHLKQYGEMRSGTNVIAKMLQQNVANLHVITHGPGSKHEEPDYKALAAWPDKLQFLISVRDPYSWMYGILWRSRAEPGFGTQLLNGQYDLSTLFENAELHGRLIERFNRKHRAWAELLENCLEITYVVRLEDIFRSQEAAVRDLVGKLGLVVGDYQSIDRECLPGSERYGGPFTRADFYLGHGHLRGLTKHLKGLISDNIWWEVMEKFGYRRLE